MMAKTKGGLEPRPLRADAERNRRRVLEVAQEVFAADGLNVPIDVIAQRAGLGVGTLYRHFPTKEALFAAIIVDRMEFLTARAEELTRADDAGAAFFAYLETMVAESAKKKDFVHALGDSYAGSPLADDAKKAFRRALDTLVSSAQRARAIRDDVTSTDILAMLHGVVSTPPAARARFLAVVADGLRLRES